MEIHQVAFAYHNTGELVLDGITLSVSRGEHICILGPSGCGKTTLLRLIGGFLVPSNGSILVDGQMLANHEDAVTMVFQGPSLFPWKTALENVIFGLPSPERKQLIAPDLALNWLRLARLESKAHKYPHQLSGGQQQRVALLRALATRPRLLLLDEPFASLDSRTREALQEDVSELLAAQKVTVVMVTHDIAEALFMADRLLLMPAQGSALVDLPNHEPPRPRSASFRDLVPTHMAQKRIRQLLSASPSRE